MFVTVAICTWNRCDLLDRTLAGLQTLTIPPGVEWEVIVVDNNSTDRTAAVLTEHEKAGKLPLRRLFEPVQGHTTSRNTAIAHARGDLMLWTDDDVEIDPGWLAAHAAAADRWPHAGFFGGTIAPWYEVPPPAWIARYPEKFEGMLVLRQMTEPEGVSDHWFFGANMAFRTSVLRRRPFDTALGLRGGDRVVGDETRLMELLRADGEVGVWVPAARLRHYTPADRLRLRYAWRYYKGLGRTEIRIAGPGSSGVPRYLYRAVATNLFGAVWAALRGRGDWVLAFLNAAHKWGTIVELRARSRGEGRL